MNKKTIKERISDTIESAQVERIVETNVRNKVTSFIERELECDSWGRIPEKSIIGARLRTTISDMVEASISQDTVKLLVEKEIKAYTARANSKLKRIIANMIKNKMDKAMEDIASSIVDKMLADTIREYDINT